jgi:hypothetical protein
MQIKCTGCNKPLSIPDDKLPKDKVVFLNCPSCKTRIKVDQHLQPPSGQGAASPNPTNAEDPKNDTLDAFSIVSSSDDEDDDDVKLYDESDQLALVLDDANKSAWTQYLTDMGYKIEYSKSPEKAVHKMKFTQFHVVVLHENFGGVALEESPFYQTVKEMPMSTRRKIFVALVGKNLKSASNMQAFQYSVNLVINEKDIGKVPQVMKKAISDNDAFYKIFKETLKALGKV